MKTLITVIATIFSFYAADASTSISEKTNTMVDSLTDIELLEEVPFQLLPIRMLSSKDGSRLFLESTTTIRNVSVEIRNDEGAVYFFYSLPIFTEVDLSLNLLPGGTYYCLVSTDDGYYSSEVKRK